MNVIAIFGIQSGPLNLVANLFVLFLVVVYLALIVWTYGDARRRISDPMLVFCATAAACFPFFGPIVYMILRPPEFLDDARERELEMAAAEARLVQLNELSCPHCHHPIERAFLRCPHCHRRLKEPCVACGKPLDPRWQVCPYCEHEVGEPAPARRRRSSSSSSSSSSPSSTGQQAPARQSRAASAEAQPRRSRPSAS
jgi:hypothetical protein